MINSVNNESLSIYESWNIEMPSVSTRSKLYNLEPIGMGTGCAESLTSYMARLAAAHSLTPAVLLGRTLASLMDKKYWLQGGARTGTSGSALGNSFGEHAKAINGVGTIARDWVTALERVTLRNDLSFLPMLPWADVFTQRNLLRSSRAWCSICYDEWRASNQVVYELLLWTFRDIEVCVKHQRRLSHRCQHCDRNLPWLARCGQPGYCSKCGEWLGASLNEASTQMAIPDHELERQTWIAKNLEEMIMAAKYLPSAPKERMAKSISLCINQASEGIMNRFACLIGKRKNTVWGWQHGRTRIPIDDLLRIGHRFGVSLVDFLYAEVFVLKEVELSPAMVFASGVKTIRQPPRAFDRETTEQSLRKMLKDQPPLPMKTVATRLNFNKRFLYKHFPELCKAISARRRKHQQASYVKLQSQYQKDIRQAATRLRASGIYPSRRRVAALIAKPLDLHDGATSKTLSVRNLQIAA